MLGAVGKQLRGCLAVGWSEPTTIFLHILKESEKGTLMDFNEKLSRMYLTQVAVALMCK